MHAVRIRLLAQILYSLYRDWKRCIGYGTRARCAVAVQFSVKHPYTNCYQAINPYTTMADKETTFCTIFMNGYLGNATLYPRSRHTMTYNKPSGSHQSEQDEVLITMRGVRGTPSKGINLTTEKRFCAITGISKVLEFIRPDSALLHCRPQPSEQMPSMQLAFSFQERYAQPGKVSHSKLPLETSLNVPQKHNTIENYETVCSCIVESVEALKRR